ncbi:MAG: hypothetical protein WCJ64_03470 [Rhodospirillaceae bacterium]
MFTPSRQPPVQHRYRDHTWALAPITPPTNADLLDSVGHETLAEVEQFRQLRLIEIGARRRYPNSGMSIS